jgi:hypothetical protein
LGQSTKINAKLVTTLSIRFRKNLAKNETDKTKTTESKNKQDKIKIREEAGG